MQIWQDRCYRRAEIASFTPSPINRAVAGSDFPRTRLPECSYSPSSFAFCRTSFSSRQRKLAVSAVVRPWAISFVRSLMSIADQARLSLRPSSYLAGPACGINAGRTLSVPTENPHGPHSAPDRNVFSSVQGTG